MTDRTGRDCYENEKEFEIPQELLETVFDELPPESIIAASNPSSLGMGRIIAGIALSGITVNILALNHILPAIAAVLLVLGFRNLRSENFWFKLAYICAVLRLAAVIPQLILYSTVYSDLLQEAIGKALQYALCGIQMLMIFAFWKAIDRIQDKAGIKDESFSGGALFIWYSLLYIASAVGFNGTIAAIAMIIAFVMIIRSLISISDYMARDGYLVTASPVKISDSVLSKALFGIIITGVAAGYVFCSSYDLSWTPAQINAYSGDEIYEHLLALGYPEEQLKDLSSDELELLKDADCLFAELDEIPLNSGVEKTEYEDGGSKQVYTDYPVKELQLIHVAVRIAGDGSEGEKWRIIHHFKLDDDLKVKGTANLQLWPTEMSEGWEGTENLSGRLFCSRKGTELTADYHFIGIQSYMTMDFFGNSLPAVDCMCDFSMPVRAINRRGYVAYTSKQIEDGYLLNSWINYTHQTGYVQYPVKTAHQYAQEGMHILDYPFIKAQAALQFYIQNGKPYIE